MNSSAKLLSSQAALDKLQNYAHQMVPETRKPNSINLQSTLAFSSRLNLMSGKVEADLKQASQTQRELNRSLSQEDNRLQRIRSKLRECERQESSRQEQRQPYIPLKKKIAWQIEASAGQA